MEQDRNRKAGSLLYIQAIILLACLAVQYALGMYVNLFIQFPQNATAGQLWEFSWRQPSLSTHILLGILILIGSLVFMIRAIFYKSSTWKTPAILGFLGVFLAAFGGSSFISTQSDAYSYVMALAFIVPFFAYAWGLMKDKLSG
jgi:hypothetical protein